MAHLDPARESGLFTDVRALTRMVEGTLAPDAVC